MRKMKKINGYLVVRFNDREKREYEGTGLGNYGVIDAELYTGILDVDRSVMEYDNAETLEIAIEQARGLESELDVVEPETKITVIIEGETEVSEEEVEPESLFKEQRTLLESQLKTGQFSDLDPRTAAHELYGYTKALEDLGMIDGHDERFMVEQNISGEVCHLCTDEGHRVNMMLPSWAGMALVSPHDFEEGETFTGCTVQTLKCRRCGMESFAWSKGMTPGQEETLAFICDEVCKHRESRTQEELDAICEECRVGRWAGAPPGLTPKEVRDLRNLFRFLKEVDNYTSGKPAPPKRSVYRLEMKLPEGTTLEDIQEAVNAAHSDEPPREKFQHFPETGDGLLVRKVYRLGLAMEAGCPDNDCIIYRNNFRMARELDEALDGAQGYAAEVLQRELGKHVRELRRMCFENDAVKAYRKEMSL